MIDFLNVTSSWNKIRTQIKSKLFKGIGKMLPTAMLAN